MLLVGQLDSPFVRRVAVSMTLLGVPFERDRSSVFGNFEDVSRINPLGRVPALVLDDGTVLVDRTAILDWLDGEVGPEGALMPPPGPTRIACWRLVALGLGANEKLLAIVYEHLMRTADQRSASWIERCRGQIEGTLATLDDAAADAGPWLLGDRLTQADITVATMLGFLRLVEPATGITPPDEKQWPHLKRLTDNARRKPRSPPASRLKRNARARLASIVAEGSAASGRLASLMMLAQLDGQLNAGLSRQRASHPEGWSRLPALSRLGMLAMDYGCSKFGEQQKG